MQDDAIWLVKTGDKILGPFTTGEVTERLLSKDFVVIDEVTSPSARWRYIREEPLFANAVEEIRAGLMSAREDTEVQGATTTLTFTSTELTSSISSAGINASSVTRLPLDLGSVKDADFIDFPNKPSSTPVRQYGFGEDRNVQQSAAKKGYLLWGALTAVAAVGIAFMVMKHGPSGGATRSAPRAEDFPALVSAANTAYRMGDFSEAAKLFKQAESLKPGVPEIVLRQAILKITQDGQTVEGKRAIQELLREESLSGAARADAKAALGLVEIMGEDYKSAYLTLEAASKDAPEHEATWFNLGAAAYLLKSIDQASKQFKELKARADSSAAALMYARTLALKGKEADYQAAGESLESVMSKSDFQQEAAVLGAYYDLQTGNRKRSQARVRAAVESDPYQTEEHYHDPLQYRAELSWKYLLPFCEDLNAKLKTSSARALLGICLVKSGRVVDAQKIIADSLAVAPDAAGAAVLQAANAYVLRMLGRDEDARGGLRLAVKGEAPRLAIVLAGRDCAAVGDDQCAAQAWKKLAMEPVAPPIAATGLAVIAIKQGQRADAESRLGAVLSQSPTYLPAQKLMAKLENEAPGK